MQAQFICYRSPSYRYTLRVCTFVHSRINLSLIYTQLCCTECALSELENLFHIQYLEFMLQMALNNSNSFKRIVMCHNLDAEKSTGPKFGIEPSPFGQVNTMKTGAGWGNNPGVNNSTSGTGVETLVGRFVDSLTVQHQCTTKCNSNLNCHHFVH